MATVVVYDGPRDRKDPSTEMYVDGERFVAGVPREVKDDDLAQELTSGESARLKGHKFSRVEGDDADDAAKMESAGAGSAPENLGGGSAGGSAGATGRATART